MVDYLLGRRRAARVALGSGAAGAHVATRQHVADPTFRAEMEELFNGPHAGVVRLPWLWDVEARMDQVELRLAALEDRLNCSATRR